MTITRQGSFLGRDTWRSPWTLGRSFATGLLLGILFGTLGAILG